MKLGTAAFAGIVVALIVAACSGGGSPEDVVRAKFQAVIDGDRDAYRAAIDPGELTLFVGEDSDNYGQHRSFMEGCSSIHGLQRVESSLEAKVEFSVTCDGFNAECSTFPEMEDGRWYSSISLPVCRRVGGP